MQKNAVVVTIISVIAVFGFLFLVYFLSNKTSEKPAQVYQETTTTETDDHIKWSYAKKVLLVEYADFQCPGCKSFHSILTQFENDPEIKKNVTFVFRHFPLTIHKNAILAARAAEAAGEQGKFWEMADLLYQGQESWGGLGNPTDHFTKLAQQLKLDTEKFQNDMASKEIQKRIDADIASGYRVQVNSTPTFFLQGKKLEVNTFDEFKKLLQDVSGSKR